MHLSSHLPIKSWFCFCIRPGDLIILEIGKSENFKGIQRSRMPKPFMLKARVIFPSIQYFSIDKNAYDHD